MISSVQRRRTFADFRSDGRRVRHGSVRLNHLPVERLPAGSETPQLAFAIGRRFGNAVTRNRGRRRLNAAFHDAWTALTPDRAATVDGAYLVSGSPAVLSAPFTQLVADITACFDQVRARSTPVGDGR